METPIHPAIRGKHWLSKHREQLAELETPTIRVYAFQPKGHGELSFYVGATSEEEARGFVQKYIEETLNKPPGFPSDARGWGTDYYEVSEFLPGEVAVNPND